MQYAGPTGNPSFSGRFGSNYRGAFNPTGLAVLYAPAPINLVASTGTLTIDLFGHTGGEEDALNLPLVFAKVGWIYAEMVTGPVTTAYFTLAPAGSNGFAGPLGSGVQVQDAVDFPCGVDGFAVNSTHRYLVVANPSPVAVSINLIVAGN